MRLHTHAVSKQGAQLLLEHLGNAPSQQLIAMTIMHLKYPIHLIKKSTILCSGTFEVISREEFIFRIIFFCFWNVYSGGTITLSWLHCLT